MKSNWVALGTVTFFFINAVVPTTFVFGDPTPPNPLLKHVVALEASVDSGQVKLEDAVDQFSVSIANEDISVDSVEALAQMQMSAEQYTRFKANIDSSLRGIDPSTLTPQEMGDLVSQVISQTRTQGLYWDGCAVMYSGIALAVASVVIGVIGIVKSTATNKIAAYNAAQKQQAQAQIDSNNQTISQSNQQIAQNDSNYSTQIQSTQQALANSDATVDANVDTQVSNIQNWQTVYPQLITKSANQVSTDDDQIRVLTGQLDADASSYPSNSPTLAQLEVQIGAQITAAQDDLNSAVATVSAYEAKISTYTANPAQAAVDAAALDASRASLKASAVAGYQNTLVQLQTNRDQFDATVNQNIATDTAKNASIESDLNTSITQYTDQQNASASLGKKLAIGGGIGAAVGAAMIIAGANSNSDCGDDF